MLERIRSANYKMVAGVEVFQKGEDTIYNAVVLNQHKGRVSPHAFMVGITSIEELSNFIGSNVPAHIALSTRGVLHRMVGMSTGKQHLLDEVFPNAKQSDFYFQRTGMGDKCLVSVARKSMVEEILASFALHGVWVTDLALGPIDVQSILPFLAPANEICASGYTISFDGEGRLTKFERTEPAPTQAEAISIGGDEIDSRLLTAYAVSFKAFLPKTAATTEIKAVSANQSEYFHKQLANKAFKWIAYGLLAVLLSNTMLYFHFKDKNDRAKKNLSKKQYELTILDSLKKQIAATELMLGQAGVNNNTSASFYADRIAASLPPGIQLVEMDVFPMKGKKDDYKPNDIIQYQTDMVRVKGRCESSLVYNNWLQNLKEQTSWVKATKHLTYREDGPALKTFEMNILIAEPLE